MFPRLRTIIESEQFAADCEALIADIQRLDAQLESVKWAVARNPEVFTRVVQNVYVIETMSLTEDGEYVFIYFTIDNADECTLRRVIRGSEVVGVDETIEVEVP
jgi:hypothetical protein